jgi:hypothetical protein
VSRTELGRIINPRVIAIKDWTPISNEIDFPALAELLNAARDWYKSSSRGYEEKLTGEMNEAIDVRQIIGYVRRYQVEHNRIMCCFRMLFRGVTFYGRCRIFGKI